MTTEKEMRGYDDTKYLEAMGMGIMTGEYTSVEHAARTVLNEVSGSNVDRLRRKFRQDGWFIKGRDNFIRAQFCDPEPRLGYGEDTHTASYHIKAFLRFFRQPTRNCSLIVKGEFYGAEVARRMLAVSVPMAFPIPLLGGMSIVDHSAIPAALLALLLGGLGVVAVVGEAQKTLEFYGNVDGQ